MQFVGASVVHTLLVLQVEAAVALPDVQVPAAHGVPDGHFWQPPLPLQRPFVPQVEAA